ncbi:MAG: bifunctional DNA-formamidopyrimidine glycosylase/DNA-(apurinic or apyrimidinic site) lyase [Akkermansiaceae bacterium]|nr:bifunctional DNA-formamidopyrimidine glycosylase/DNA-(apurinic or apyrimidinic site) lyase [Akkermansiaceae bacterium]MCF7732580.1 bifunctional DNA-formamidopyrimidine glycosylase/DNA-(apurinic or apyrimidinic site) lyase [Akkermansiaceae bacterium]
MPELPEVETTRRGIEPHVARTTIREVIIRRHDLRQPVSPSLAETEGRRIKGVTRRAKYLLLAIADGSTILIHLGMSGSLRVAQPNDDWKKHDHVAITLGNGGQLRFHDPRRFGLVLHLTDTEPLDHPLLCKLGPEPLEEAFTPAFLKAACATRSAAIKSVIMDNQVVVGVGNIYAAEALFLAGIHPLTPADRLTLPRLRSLTDAIRAVLTDAIAAGGTTLRDFLRSDGSPGYFKQHLFVYDRAGQPCRRCATLIARTVSGQRATCWCPKCQPKMRNRSNVS